MKLKKGKNKKEKKSDMNENEALNEETKQNVKMSPPWIVFANKVRALFEQDPEIKITFNEDSNELKLLVNGQTKADALTKLLPAEKKFGNVTLKITVIPSNALKGTSELFLDAFYRNPALIGYVPASGVFDVNYLVFQKKVVQFFSDNIGDVNGNISTLYENIAREVFEDSQGVYFCTDARDPV